MLVPGIDSPGRSTLQAMFAPQLHLDSLAADCATIAEIVQPGQIAGPDPEKVSDDELRSWFEEGAALLGAALASAEPEQPCWTFGFPPGEAWFWMRRQALETLIHRVDVETACGKGWPIDRNHLRYSR